MFGLTAADLHALEHAFAVFALLALRVSPTAFCLAWSAPSLTLRVALGLALAISLWPLALRVTPAELAAGPQLWAAIPWELARGTLLGFGSLLPALALGWAGRTTDTARDPTASVPDTSPLERLYGAAAAALLFASGAHTLLFRALAGSLSDVPLGRVSTLASVASARAALLELAKLVARAFELSVVWAAPVLIVIATAFAIAALATRIAAPVGAALGRGPLLPVLGLSGACLGISSILGSLPPALAVFVRKTLELLAGLR
jgi:type III secretory pathway component EscT